MRLELEVVAGPGLECEAGLEFGLSVPWLEWGVPTLKFKFELGVGFRRAARARRMATA